MHGSRRKARTETSPAVGYGEAIFSPAIAARVLDFFTAACPAVPKEAFPTLIDREREFLQLIAQGHTNADIARHWR